MPIHLRAGTLIPALAFATALLLAPRAQAVQCSSEILVEVFQSFDDCAGNENFRDDAGTMLLHDANFEGPSQARFSDLHITFLDPEVTDVAGSFEHDGQQWDVETMNSPDGVMIWFTAPTAADRVDPGEDYDWGVDLFGNISDLLNVRIEYTMDVPEPSAALLLTPAFLGLVGLAAARRRRLN